MADRSRYEDMKFNELRTLARERQLGGDHRRKRELIDALVSDDAARPPLSPTVRLDPETGSAIGRALAHEVPPIVAGALGAIADKFPALTTIERALTRPLEVPDEKLSVFWMAILLHSESIAFPRFDEFLMRVVGGDPGKEANPRLASQIDRLRHLHPIPGTDMYGLLKTAAEAFLLLQGGVAHHDLETHFPYPMPLPIPRDAATGAQAAQAVIDRTVNRLMPQQSLTYREAERVLATFLGTSSRSYLRAIIPSVFPGGRVTPASSQSAIWDHRLISAPAMIELIWSYWMEEGMLTQTMNAITHRFQNVRRNGGRDPLAELELDPLRPLGGFIWGYIQDEPNRLSVVRRAYEYNHHYGLTMYGRAIPPMRTADPRSRFIEAFHTLLRECDLFIKLDNDMTVNPDAFAVLSSLKEVHLVLSEGAHNQFRDLPWTARAEMLLQQWMIARPEMKEFLRGRLMVAYPEQWMGGVDAMKRLQGWHPASSINFNDLARYGERLLLSIRYVAWNSIGDQAFAKAWVRFWKEEIQGYIHAYEVVTGVSLTDTPVVQARTRDDGRFLPPAVHLRNRMLRERTAR